MMLIIENPNAEDDRTVFTLGSPCKFTVSGYVIWSSTSCGLRPGQSVNRMTWFSLRSGVASIGVFSSAQYPHAATSTYAIRIRKRFFNENSINRLIMAPSLRVETRAIHTEDLAATPGFDCSGPRPGHRNRSASHVLGSIPFESDRGTHLAHSHGRHRWHHKCHLHFSIAYRTAVRTGDADMECAFGAAFQRRRGRSKNNFVIGGRLGRVLGAICF